MFVLIFQLPRLVCLFLPWIFCSMSSSPVKSACRYIIKYIAILFHSRRPSTVNNSSGCHFEDKKIFTGVWLPGGKNLPADQLGGLKIHPHLFGSPLLTVRLILSSIPQTMKIHPASNPACSAVITAGTAPPECIAPAAWQLAPEPLHWRRGKSSDGSTDYMVASGMHPFVLSSYLPACFHSQSASTYS